MASQEEQFFFCQKKYITCLVLFAFLNTKCLYLLLHRDKGNFKFNLFYYVHIWFKWKASWAGLYKICIWTCVQGLIQSCMAVGVIRAQLWEKEDRGPQMKQSLQIFFFYYFLKAYSLHPLSQNSMWSVSLLPQQNQPSAVEIAGPGHSGIIFSQPQRGILIEK